MGIRIDGKIYGKKSISSTRSDNYDNDRDKYKIGIWMNDKIDRKESKPKHDMTYEPAVQLLLCGVLLPGLVQYCSQRYCVNAVKLFLHTFS